jgi:recombination protein RecA
MAVDRLEKTYGKGTVMRMGDSPVMDVEVIPSGSLGLDIALGINGFPKGRVVEIYGPESSGKTTLAIHAIAECQKQGGIAAFIDAEHAFDRHYAAKPRRGYGQPAHLSARQRRAALEIAENLIRSGAIDIIVIDSVAALVPRSEIEGEMGDSKVGLQARLMSQEYFVNKVPLCFL